jgi:amino acid adenylation domain-containing protein
MDRSLEMITGVLGILKAGGAYVPMEPSYPRDRLAFIMKDIRMPVLLTQQHLAGSIPVPEHRMDLIDVDTRSSEIANEGDLNPDSGSEAASLAYVTYTSGSTGEPKGVSIEHRGVVRLVTDTNYMEFSSKHVFLVFAPLSFDVSTFELWGGLLNGSRLVVFHAHTPSIEELGRFIAEKRITVLWLTSALFMEMVDSQMERLREVQYVLSGGDILPVAPVLKMLPTRINGFKLINGYGPTENTTFTCCFVMDSSTTFGQSVPIGKPVRGTQVYILDRNGQLVPAGVAGELHAGGAGLAREYYRRPELTHQKFIPNPFSNAPGARLYKTGDVARYLPDGNIEFLGRIDDQVKIRGFRVEPGEIEAVLRQHPDVGWAVVLAGNDRHTPVRKHLIAYVVPKPGTTASVTDLRHFLKRKLPAYMAPSGIVFLESFPLTSSGKVDRTRLRDADCRYTSEKVFVTPRTPTEIVLAGIWKEVLGITTAGADDNFFELGGDSLLAMQVVTRLRKAFNIELPLRSVFDRPVLAKLAECVQNALEKT